MNDHTRHHDSASNHPTRSKWCGHFEKRVPLLSAGCLALDEELSLRAHLGGCAWCQALLASYEVVNDALREHVSSEQTEGGPFSLEGLLTAADNADFVLDTPLYAPPDASVMFRADTDAEVDEDAHTDADRDEDLDSDATRPLGGDAAAADARFGATQAATERGEYERAISRMLRTLSAVSRSATADSLRIPDHPDWHLDAGYSSAVAQTLVHAYSILRSDPQNVAHYLVAYERIMTCLHYSMSANQRLRVMYLLALAAAAADEDVQAIGYVDNALELAERAEETTALVELYHLRGTLNGSLWRYGAAADDQDACLNLLRGLAPAADPSEPSDAALTLDVLLELIASEFMVAHYEQAARHLDEARLLVAQVARHQRQAATLEWLNALLLRWRGEPNRALGPAIAAADAYAGLNVPAATARIQSIVADIALDIAEAFPSGGSFHAREALLTLAEPYVHSATTLAREAGNASVEGITLVASCRLQRIRRPDSNVIPIIESVRHAAEQRDDLPLLVQTMTALGHELDIQGSHTGAMQCYRRALGMVEKSEVLALGVPARRALYHASEMRPGEE